MCVHCSANCYALFFASVQIKLISKGTLLTYKRVTLLYESIYYHNTQQRYSGMHVNVL